MSQEGTILQFIIDRDTDPDGSKLRKLLKIQFAYERMRAGRLLCVHLMAVVGGFVWLEAIWPALLPSEVQLFTLVLWGALFAVALLVTAEEYVLHRRLQQHRTSSERMVHSRLKEPL